MKKFFPRITALALALLLLAGCGGVKPIEPTEEDLQVVMQASGYDVCYDEVRYYALNLKDQMAEYHHADIWADSTSAAPYIEELNTGIDEMSRYNAAVLSLCAEYGISISEPLIEEGVQTEVEGLVEEMGGMKAYKEALAQYHMTDRLFRYMTAITLCETELYNVVLTLDIIDDSDEGAQAFFESDEFIRTLHVYIGNDEGDSVEDNRAKAETVLKKLNEGADFNQMIGSYSEDFYMTTTNGYYFSRGEMDPAYEEAAFALEVNAHSGVVETDSGFFIIRRLPKDLTYIKNNFDSLKTQYLSTCFYNIIEERRNSITLSKTEFGKSIQFWEIQ